MATTYVLRDTNSGLATPASGRFYKELLTSTGTAGTVTSGAIAGGLTVDGYAFTDVGVPGAAPGTIGGAFSVEMNVTVSSTTCNITCAIAQVSSTGTQKNTTSFATQQGATTGMHLFSFPSVAAWTWAAGDRMRVTYRYVRTSTMGSETVTITANTVDAQVVAPWTITPTVTGVALGAVTATGTASGTKEVFGSASGPVAATGSAAGEVVTPGIATTSLTTGSSATAGTSFVTASVDPADDAVVWLAVSIRHATAEPTTPTISGCGLTWALVDAVYFDQLTTRTKLFVFRGHHATPSAGTITISHGATSHDGAVWNVTQSVGVNSPANPVVKATPVNSGTATSGALDFGSAVTTGNAVVSFLSLFDNTAGQVTPEAGYSQVAYAGPEAGESNLSVGTYWDQTGADQTPAWTWTVSALWGAVAVELAPVVEGEVTGAALGAVSVGATATGAVERFGVAASTVAAAGVAAGLPAKTAVAASAVTADATALGVRTVFGVALGAVTATATASGTSVPTVTGTALGAVTATGTASGQKTVTGAAVGAATAAATVVGQKTVTGQAVGAVTATGTAAGQVAGQTPGQALGTVTATATAVGVRTVFGVAQGAVTAVGAAAGQVTPTVFGQAVGAVTVTATATGTRTVTGQALGAVAAQGAASGGVVITVTGVAVGAVTATGIALGVSGPPIVFGVNIVGRSSSPNGRGSTTPGKDTRGRTLVGVNVR